MTTLYIANAFSPSMIAFSDYLGPVANLNFVQIPQHRAVEIVRDQEILEQESLHQYPIVHEVVSCVGHANTAAVFSSLLDTEVLMNRVSVKLGPNDRMIIGTPNIRLPEGATELPEGTQITWLLVEYN
jgi:hypothetical protein